MPERNILQDSVQVPQFDRAPNILSKLQIVRVDQVLSYISIQRTGCVSLHCVNTDAVAPAVVVVSFLANRNASPEPWDEIHVPPASDVRVSYMIDCPIVRINQPNNTYTILMNARVK